MANEIRGPGVRPGAAPEKPNLNEVEAQKAKQAHAQKISSQDASRLAQQAGFQRTKPGVKKGIDVGDSSKAPIPLPDDEADTEVWNPDTLEKAQENMSMASAQFGEVAKGGEDVGSLGEAVVASSFMPTEAGVAQLQLLADRPAPEPIPLEEATTSVRQFFNIDLPDEVPMGQKMLVAGLVAAGEASAVEVRDGQVNEQRLASGLQKVAERSNQAVGEAQKMTKGVSRELNLQRTFVFKR